MADDALDQPTRAPQAPAEVAALNAWMDAQLGRPLSLMALLRAGLGDDDPLAGWRVQRSEFPQVELVELVVDDGEPIAEALARVAQRDPDALLVCADTRDDAEAAQRWRTAVLGAAEDLNLFERTEIALVGAGMTREVARRRGFEDGFATEQPLVEALAILAREAVTRAAYRRYGSSPPCYL